ncbi:MAG: alpha/beta fold hydrolase [Gemmatimonadetes bacterium]|nr:alpha/beta fold hydrolase [Gemmatimonadota bacterium]
MPLALLALAVAALVLLALLPGFTPRIDRRRHPAGLASLEPVPVGGTRQWLLIRSEDARNPVVLFVHGGPGTSVLALNRRISRALEAHFSVVNWDQRGAGKSFAAGRDPAGMQMARFVDDVIEVASHLADRFRQRRILLVGHSWGTVIGLLAVARRPDLFSGYVGIGQASRMAESERLSYDWTLERARAAADAAAVRTLERIEPPPYTGSDWRAKFMTERRLLGRFGGEYHGSRAGAFGVVLKSLVLGTEYTLADRVNFFRGIFRSVELLFPELYGTDLFVSVPEVRVPVWFCLGRHDWEVPAVLSARYFDALGAPRKELVWFENSAHLPNTEEKDRFNAFLIGTVRPVLVEHDGRTGADRARLSTNGLPASQFAAGRFGVSAVAGQGAAATGLCPGTFGWRCPMYRVRASIVVATVLFLSSCASLGMNSVQKLKRLSPGMSSDQVQAIMGEPKSSEMREDQWILRYTLHENWKGWVPYYMVFDRETRTLKTWYADEAEYQRMQAQMAETFKPVTDAAAPNQGGAAVPAGRNDPSLQRWITGKYYYFSSSMVVSAASERTLDLCEDGRFRMTGEFAASGRDPAWGAASQSGNRGRWTIAGDRLSGTITLTLGNGSSRNLRYQVASQAEQTMLFDGVKFAFAGRAVCD